jgi:formate dehydrogenase assembly factor FdhD
VTEILDFEEHKIKHANRNKLHIHYKSKPAVREDDREMVLSSVGVASIGDDNELVVMVHQMEGSRLDTLTFTPNEIPYLMDALQEAYDYVAEEEQ